MPNVLREVPSVPGLTTNLRKMNAGITLTAVHDSATGWYTLITPAISYAFSPRYSADLSIPVYLYRLGGSEMSTTTPSPNAGGPPIEDSSVSQLYAHTLDPGDVVLAAHASFVRRRVDDILTPSMTLPSGDSTDGLSTGRVTFDVSNRTEVRVRSATALLDLGGGDSSNLVNRLVTQNYTSLGPLAHFQAGLRVPLPRSSTFQSVAYEQLPLGDGKIYTTLRRPGFADRTVVSGRSVSEDNGFTNVLLIPLSRRFSLQGYYNRSMRLRLDTVGMGISYVARSPGLRQDALNEYDQLFRR